MTNSRSRLLFFAALLLAPPFCIGHGAAAVDAVPPDTGTAGLLIRVAEGTTRVIDSFPDLGAGKGGAIVNDTITHVDGQSIAGKALKEVVSALRGEIGSLVMITLKREGKTEPINILAERVPLKQVISAQHERRLSE